MLQGRPLGSLLYVFAYFVISCHCSAHLRLVQTGPNMVTCICFDGIRIHTIRDLETWLPKSWFAKAAQTTLCANSLAILPRNLLPLQSIVKAVQKDYCAFFRIRYAMNTSLAQSYTEEPISETPYLPPIQGRGEEMPLWNGIQISLEFDVWGMNVLCICKCISWFMRWKLYLVAFSISNIDLAESE